MASKTKTKTEKDKDIEKDDDPTSLFILNSPPSEQPKLRMIGLFEELDEEKTGDICTALLALKEMGKEEIYENPDDPMSKVKETTYKPIDFNISTPGGLALGMFAVYDVMRQVRQFCDIRTTAYGRVMSAGVLLLAAGTKGSRKIGANCRVMIHSVAGGHWGSVHNLENEMDEIRWIQEQHINALVKETDLTKKHLKKMLDRKVNVYLDAKQAIEFGIADEII